MNFNEYLLTCLSEEASEVAHRVSKALRFSLNERHHSNPTQTNADLIAEELTDLLAVADMARDAGLIPAFGQNEQKLLKIHKVYRYAKMSAANCGTLQINAHQLWKDGDYSVPLEICDRNGQVALALCKVCGKGEGDLQIECPGPQKCFDVDKC
jgi:NTP pyrophosphatase (non-canonical NTP hydrolase)